MKVIQSDVLSLVHISNSICMMLISLCLNVFQGYWVLDESKISILVYFNITNDMDKYKAYIITKTSS